MTDTEYPCVRCGTTMMKNLEFNHDNNLTPEDEDYKAQSAQMDETTETMICGDCFTDEEAYEQYKIAHELIMGHTPYNCDENGSCCCENKCN